MLGDDFVPPNYQFDNRGKRGVCINLEDPEGPELVRRLAAEADIFLTNLTWSRIQRYGLSDTAIHAIQPKMVYGVLSGYGTQGPDSEREAFDQTAFWARSGAMSVFGDRDDGPLLSRGGYGDRTTALNMLAALLAALRVQEQTGEGQFVEVTLQRTGIWALATDVCNALDNRLQPEKTSQAAPANPIWNFYRTADDRWLALVMPMAMRYWPKFCDMLGREDWRDDENMQSLTGLMEHGLDLVGEIGAIFAGQDLNYWRSKLDAAGLIWEPVAELPEVVEDPALRERGAFSVVIHEQAGAMEIVSAPFYIRDADVAVRGPAPDVGQHTREVFGDAGLTSEQLDALFAQGVIA
jgi:crotonobetainyl-CoA:carnitine CoA-transferase CaiB-like acyl-CoA transferase